MLLAYFLFWRVSLPHADDVPLVLFSVRLPLHAPRLLENNDLRRVPCQCSLPVFFVCSLYHGKQLDIPTRQGLH